MFTVPFPNYIVFFLNPLEENEFIGPPLTVTIVDTSGMESLCLLPSNVFYLQL